VHRIDANPLTHSRAGARPTVSTVSPSSLPFDSTLAATITVTGSQFRPGAIVTIAGWPSDSVMLNDENSIDASIPHPLPIGCHHVAVINNDGTAAVAFRGLCVAGLVMDGSHNARADA